MSSPQDPSPPGSHPRWLFPTATLVIIFVIAGLTALFAGAGLDGADQLGSVVGAIVAVIVPSATLLTWLRLRRRPGPPVASGNDIPGASWSSDPARIGNTARLAGNGPDWPATYPGYRFDRSGEDTVRVFSHQGPAVVQGFPATMNGGGHRHFFVRWRSLGDLPVTAAVVSMPDLLPLAEPVTGTSGWITSHGCGQPSWSLSPDLPVDDAEQPPPSPMTDVVVTWQVWVPTA